MKRSEELKEELMRRWRFPTLTVHAVESSAPKGSATLISRSAKAEVSMRTVPNQIGPNIVESFNRYVQDCFSRFSTTDCQIHVRAKRVADWWLGNPENKYFRCLARAVEEEWKQKPMYIREGGSIPPVRWLEKLFQAPAINFPMGQASDSAHLNDERIRLKNLFAGKRILKAFFTSIGTGKCPATE